MEDLHRPHDLRGGEAELGVLAPGGLPLPRPLGLELVADAQKGLHAELLGEAEDPKELGELFQGDHHVAAKLPPHEGEADEVVVLEAVGGDEGLLGEVLGQDEGELGLAPRLRAEVVGPPRPGHGLQDQAALVHLHRVDPPVGALVAVLRHGLQEGLVEVPDPGLRGSGKAEHEGQGPTLVPQGLHDLQEGGRGALGAQGGDLQIPLLPHPEEAPAPVGHQVKLLRVLKGEALGHLQRPSTSSPSVGPGGGFGKTRSGAK